MLGTDRLPAADSHHRAPLKAGGKLSTAARIRFLSSTVNVDNLRPSVKKFVEDNAWVMQPERIHVCDGSEEENRQLLQELQQDGRLIKLQKYENWSVFPP